MQATAQYMGGRFRVPFDCDSVSVHQDYVFPLTARAYAVPKDFSLDALTDSVAKALIEADCELGAVVTPGSDVRLHAYYVVEQFATLGKVGLRGVSGWLHDLPENW